MTKPITRQRVYVSGRTSDYIVVIIICFMFVAAILNISISTLVPECHEQNSDYIGHVVSKTVI